MRQSDRKTIGNIIVVNPYVYSWQAEIEKEQERVIADMVSPAEKVVKRLIELDNRRIDLCNLKVLFGFIERGLGAEFSAFVELAACGADDALFDRALECIGRAGYDVLRVQNEFAYLFKRLPKTGHKRGRVGEIRGVSCADGSNNMTRS